MSKMPPKFDPSTCKVKVKDLPEAAAWEHVKGFFMSKVSHSEIIANSFLKMSHNSVLLYSLEESNSSRRRPQQLPLLSLKLQDKWKIAFV